MSNLKRKYNKEPLTIREQISLLGKRGVIISDKINLEKILSNINYYKLTSYLKSFEIEEDKFNCNIEEAIGLHEFDRKLRVKIFEAICIIETMFKSKIAYNIAIKYGPFGHYNLDNFKCDHENWLDKINDSLCKEKKDEDGNILSRLFKEIFIKYYHKKYSNYPQMPIWMFIEVLSLGEFSKLFSNMRYNQQIEISKYFISSDIENPYFLRNIIHIFSISRNICAHGARFWNKGLNIQLSPKYFKKTDFENQNINYRKIGGIVYLINYTLKRIYYDKNFTLTWQKEMENLIDNHPNVTNFWEQIGLSENWKEHSLWKKGEVL
ncbi:MAG: Abi family protein [Elusimicrobia bacterium]|nr:Abi family protein [Elusimicrobiota bacterium]